jgi:hypothetical protein
LVAVRVHVQVLWDNFRVAERTTLALVCLTEHDPLRWLLIAALRLLALKGYDVTLAVPGDRVCSAR